MRPPSLRAGLATLNEPGYTARIEPRLPMKARLEALLAEYGKVALFTYFAIFVLVFAGFAIAISLGVQVESAAETAGTLGAAYVATKLTQPIRIIVTLALTPLLGRLVKWLRKKPAPP